MSRLKVAVIMGGPSHEYEISLRSGQTVLEHINQEKYDAFPVEINQSGLWSVDGKEYCQVARGLKQLADKNVDVAFLAVHGNFGEDGTIQALLERKNIRYTGSSVSASLLAMDKLITEQLFQDAALITPQSVAVETENFAKMLGSLQYYPAVVKPMKLGSSVGVSIVDSAKQLKKAIEHALLYDQMALVQPYIKGREISCGVLEDEDGKPQALPPTELIPVGRRFFDYVAKYSKDTKEITPPAMPAATIEHIQQAALTAHQTIGCSGYSRTDIIIDEQGTPYVLEINTLPGLTNVSILPQQAKAIGLSYAQLVDRIIHRALTKKV